MDQKTRAFHQQLIRLAKGAIKAWEAYVAPPSEQYPSAETATMDAHSTPGSLPDAPALSRPLGHPVSLVSRTEAQNGR